MFSENVHLINFAVMNSRKIESLPEGAVWNVGCSKIRQKTKNKEM
jgi:hypothetical protein